MYTEKEVRHALGVLQVNEKHATTVKHLSAFTGELSNLSRIMLYSREGVAAIRKLVLYNDGDYVYLEALLKLYLTLEGERGSVMGSLELYNEFFSSALMNELRSVCINDDLTKKNNTKVETNNRDTVMELIVSLR